MPSAPGSNPTGVVIGISLALYDGDWEAAEAAPQSARSHVSGLVAAHLQWHLERQLKTLPLVERFYQADRSVAERRAALIGQDIAGG